MLDPLGTKRTGGARWFAPDENAADLASSPHDADINEARSRDLKPFSPVKAGPPLRGFGLKAAAFMVNLPVVGPWIRKTALNSFGANELLTLDLSSYRPMRSPAFIQPEKKAEIEPHLIGRPKRSDSPIQSSSLQETLSMLLSIAPKSGALALHHAYLAGKTTPTEVAEAYFSAVEKSAQAPHPLGAILQGEDWSNQKARLIEEAKLSTERYRKGQPLSPLDGIPFVVKDQIDAAGFPTFVGTASHDTNQTGDAKIVAHLKHAGALCLGKSNMNELGMGVTGHNPHHGPARNPFDPSRGAGGSSGGSAAAVAANLVPMSIGSDAGGSTRIPAALCGLVGLKPTWGTLSQDGVFPLAKTLQQPGPMAKNAADAAAMFSVMSGGKLSLDNLKDRSLSDVTVGIDADWVSHADEEVLASFSAMVERLRALGAKVEPIQIRGLQHAALAQAFSYLDSSASHTQNIEGHSAEAQLSLALGKALEPNHIEQAQRLRTALLEETQRALSKVDIILTPSTGSTAPILHPSSSQAGELDGATMDGLARFAVLANLTGLPAITFPGEPSEEGLPIGVQAIGGAFQESLLFRVAHAVEQSNKS